MSYPGYPTYPAQAPGQPGAPQPGAPMYQTAPLSYPIYPGAAAPQQLGFSQYTYPPQHSSPYPSATQPNSGSYPSHTTPYPTGGAPYPSTNPSGGAPFPGVNPPGGAPYPGASPSGGAPYPGANPSGGAPYPASSSPYPASSSPYPATGSPYPSANPPSSSPYPQSSPHPSGMAGPYPAAPYPSGSAPGLSSTNSLYHQQPTSHHASAAPSGNFPGYQGSHVPHSGGGRATSAPAYSQPHLTSSQSSMRAPTPTVRPANPFNPRADAEVLRKAMKGFGTDEKAIIEVLTKRSNSQRQQIALEFKTLYGKDLVSDLKSEVSGKFEQLLVALMTPIPEFLANELHHAISGIGTNEETLVEIICTANNYEMKCIKAAYEKLFGRSLEQELAGDTSGNFRRLLVSLCQANRSENYGVDPNAAFQDAQALMRAGELRIGTDESTFNAILSSRSYTQLAAVFMEYQRLTGNDFESAIKSEFSGDIEAGLVAIVRSVRDKSGFFAEQLYKSMAGAGTHDRALIRIICSRCETDLGDIKNAYQQRFGKMLSEAIHDDTSGEYMKALLSLIA